MKKHLFLFVMLASITANAAVTVTPLSVNYSAVSPTVTFKVKWTGTAANNRVWVWVDYCSVAGTSPGTFAKAVISEATATAGSIDAATLNGRGFYVTTNPSTVTATLNNATGQFNWCAYGSDFPPNIGDYNNGIYTLRGTPPFTLKDANGTTQTVPGTTIPESALTITPTIMTDETGCPGYFCKYVGSDLYMDASHKCDLRTSGARNWEAWIKDSRDNELYRIVLMPDNKWWLAQNVKYAGTGFEHPVAGCTPDKCGRLYIGNQMSSTYTGSTGASGYGANKQGICPNNWILPVYVNWRTFVDAIEIITWTQHDEGFGVWLKGYSALINERLTAYNNPWKQGNNYYGWANATFAGYNDGNGFTVGYPHESWRGNDTEIQDWCLLLTHHAIGVWLADGITMSTERDDYNRPAPVRCLRQL